jgi:hypothetical protein
MQVDIQIRNIKKIDDNTYDCEINHPQFGWIPFTASKNDIEEHGRAIFDKIKQGE